MRFESPRPTVIGEKESWTLTCIRRGGGVGRTQQVEVDRGEREHVRDACGRGRR